MPAPTQPTPSSPAAADLTFGVEIECLLPAAKVAELGLRVGGRHHGFQVPGLPVGWKAERDGSIQAEAGYEAVEIVSPKLKGAEGIAQLLMTLFWVRAAGAKVNASCGFHVHVGWAGRTEEETRRLVCLVANHEPGLYAVTGTRGREQGAFCKSIRADVSYQHRFRDGRAGVSYLDRYRLLNLQNLRGAKQTVEFRVFSGTLNQAKVMGFLWLCLGLCERALTAARPAPWEPRMANGGSAYTRAGGAGAQEVNRLFYSLNWIKGRSKADHKLGVLEVAGGPTAEDARGKLEEMADKYDRPTA